MKIIIKKFDELTVRELYEIIKLRIEAFSIEQECIYQDLDDLDFEAYHHFIEHEGQIVAYIRIFKKGVIYDEASFGRVLVKKEFRGFGLCRELILETIYFIETELGENIIKIMAQEHVIDMYRKFGFETKGDIYFKTGFPHIDMVYIKNKI